MKLRQYLKIAVSGFLCAAVILTDSSLLYAAGSGDEAFFSASEAAFSDGESTGYREDTKALTENTQLFPESTEQLSGSEQDNPVSLEASDTSREAEASSDKTAGQYKVLNVSRSDISARGAFRAVQDLLDEARDNATDAAPYKIVVPAGTYTLEHSLYIYSNTYLSMTGVTFKLPRNGKSNMLKVGEVEDNKSGYYYKNITLDGGVWDENQNNTTAVKVAHAANFTMINQTVKNVKNGHLMEIAGAKDVTIRGCTFKDQELPKNAKDMTYEAIQVDVLVKGHMTGYRFEDLPVKNLTIDQCTFTNVPRGVGSHTAVLNNPVDNIKITKCKFSKVKSAAIQGLNWINCEISGNTISGTPRGIRVDSLRQNGIYLPSTLAGQGKIPTKTSNSYVRPVSDQNIVIKNNNVTVSGQDPYVDYDTAAISVNGFLAASAIKGNGDKIPKGDYFISGATVSGNTVKTSGNGIELSDAKKSSVTKNKINYTKSNKGSGIYLSAKSTGNKINDNTIVSPNVNGIYIYTGSSASSISRNVISSSKGYGINLQGTASATLIEKNKIKSCTYHGIVIYENSSAKAIKSNTITNCKGNGITVASLKDKLEISSNKISKCAGDLIQFSTGSCNKMVTIKKNTLTGTSSQSGIFFDGKKVSIIENTISTTNVPIMLTANASGSVESNILKKNKGKITINMAGYDSPAAPKSFKASKKGKDSINLSWKKTSGASGYIVYRSTSKNGNYTKCATISGSSKTRYTDKKLKSGKTYYYKIAAFTKVSGITLGGSQSAAVSSKL